MEFGRELTPRVIVEELNKYVVGQEEAKKMIAIAVRNRWRRMQLPPELRKEVVPQNILMIGPTGVGKTEIARRLSKLIGAPFLKVEATKYTEVGYVGRDVESMIRDLVEQSYSLVKMEYLEQMKAEIEKKVEEQLLDLLVPGVPPDSPAREHMRLRLRDGELENYEVEIEVQKRIGEMHIIGGMSVEGIEGLHEFLSNVMPLRSQRKKVPIAEAREYLKMEIQEQTINRDQIAKEAVRRAENLGIIFIDEIDKIAMEQGGSHGPDVSREGVQRDLLPIVEGTVVNTRYGPVRTDHILFIAAGAFHVAKPSDLIPELQGRFPIRVELHPLSEEDLFRILTEPKNALPKQYQALLEVEGVRIEFSEAALRMVAHYAYRMNETVENIGARRLHTLMNALLQEILFKAPDAIETTFIQITPELVQETIEPLLEDKDLSQYIL
jgi:ATP-dependent HslUV protease ATP-binding subunit HslU